MIKVKTNGSKSWVTFTYIPDENTNSVVVSGEWNEWQEEPMKQKKNGEYYITKVLPIGQCYQFGYKVNGDAWINDMDCSTVPSPFSSHNSLLEL